MMKKVLILALVFLSGCGTSVSVIAPETSSPEDEVVQNVAPETVIPSQGVRRPVQEKPAQPTEKSQTETENTENLQHVTQEFALTQTEDMLRQAGVNFNPVAGTMTLDMLVNQQQAVANQVLNQNNALAHDAQRQGDLLAWRLALESYQTEFGHYPIGEACLTSKADFFITAQGDADFTLANLASHFSNQKLPNDPGEQVAVKNCNGYYYKSVAYAAGDANNGKAYILVARAEVIDNANQDCDLVGKIENLDSANLTEPRDSTVTAGWCMLAYGD